MEDKEITIGWVFFWKLRADIRFWSGKNKNKKKIKKTFSKLKPKEIIYRNYRKFNEEDFNQQLCGKLSTELINNYSSGENVFKDVLNKHALINKKFIRVNHAPYVTKTLRKAIMKRSQLKKIYFKKRTQEFFKKYKKQNNFYGRLYKQKERKSFFLKA